MSTTTMEADNKKPFKIKDVTRNIKKAVVASTLEEIRSKVAEKFEKADLLPTIHLDSDGTEIDDEEYFRTLDANTELIAVFPGEHWVDPTHYVTISSRREPHDTTDAAADTARIKQLVGQLQNNLCNVSVMSDPDLDSLSNMDPNSLVDITGKDFMDQLKDSGRPLCAKRNAQDRINLLKLLKDGAIFCSERYPEEAEAIDMEISRQLNMEMTAVASATTTTTTAIAPSVMEACAASGQQQQQQQQQLTTITTTNAKTIAEVQTTIEATGTAAITVVGVEQFTTATKQTTTATANVTNHNNNHNSSVNGGNGSHNNNNNSNNSSSNNNNNNNNKTNDI